MPKERVVVIGAGPAGLTAAYELLKKGADRFEVDVLEADPSYVGGIARTAMYKGCRFDIGGHRFFSKSQEIEDLWTEWMGTDMLTRTRMSRIYYDGKFFHYPLKATNVLGNLGLRTSVRVLASYARKRVSPIEPEVSFADWVTNRFGRRLFTMFFESYTEKVWGIPCTTLSADWAAQRIKGLSLTTAVRDAVFGKKEGDVVKSLIETFRYPRLGPGMMWERVRDLVVERGGRIHMNRRAEELRHTEGRITSILARGRDGAEQVFEMDHVISSAPIARLMPALIPSAPEEVRAAANSLSYRAFLTVVLIMNEKDVFPDQWIYIHDTTLQLGRIQNYKNWSPYMVPDPSMSCVGLEYFCDEGDELWTMSNAELIELGKREFGCLGMSGTDRVIDGTVVRMAKAYPVYDADYARHVDTIRRWVEAQAGNMQLVGRAGMHRYNNQDHAMMTALLSARNLMGGSFDPWKVNTDAEYIETRGAAE
jgi:protoporphyrinogen oxidase